LDAVDEDLAEFSALWHDRLDDAWDAWTQAQAEFTTNIETLAGAWPGSVTHKDSAGQGLRAVLNSFPADRKLRIIATEGEFDSIDFILRAYAEAGRAEVTFVAPSRLDGGLPLYAPEDVIGAVVDGIDLVVVSMVFFETGQLFPQLSALIRRSHEVGALVLVDSYHAVGAMPVNLVELDADFAVGGSYKYLRGGPGASWLAVNPRHIATRSTLDTGWFAKRDPFGFNRHDPTRGEGIAGWSESTPPIASLYQARSGIRFMREVGAARSRTYSLERLELLRGHLDGLAYQPDNPDEFGAFAVVIADDAHQLSGRLKQQGVTTDSRGRILRLCPDVLNSADELREAATLLRELVS
jgi:kynureninase